MTAIIVLAIIVMLVAFTFTRKKSRRNRHVAKPQARNKRKYPAQKRMDEIEENITDHDSSVIDVTGSSYQINPPAQGPQMVKARAPYWRHQYVYSFSEINAASPEQIEFYRLFKSSFLKGEYIDLEGNNNYAFILLFDLLKNDYEKHRDLKRLEKQLEELAYYYPKTRSYAISSLKEKMQAQGDRAGISRLTADQHDSHHPGSNIDDSFGQIYWGLGSRYKSALNLNENEVELINRLGHTDNNFCGIEYCRLEILKLFLLAVKELNRKLTDQGSSLDSQVADLAAFIVKKQYGYKRESANYKYAFHSAITELYILVFRYCENAVREYYGHKRKLNTDNHYIDPEIKNETGRKLTAMLPEILSASISTISLPDETTEIELNAQNTARWKTRLEELTENFTEPQKFIADIVTLGNLNKKNPSVENIYFEASKFMAKKDKQASLTLYVHYLYQDMRSLSFDQKQLTKTIQKTLFTTNEQLHDFEMLVSELIRDKNLDKALQKISDIYKTRRKKIQLDKDSINEVKKQHSGTVELLNDYLKDEYEDETSAISAKEINSEEVQIRITQKIEKPRHPHYISDIKLTPLQEEALELFFKSNFSLPESALAAFAKSKGVFKNQLVESINDSCFHSLDDLLIEEDDDFYIINPNYHQRIIAQ